MFSLLSDNKHTHERTQMADAKEKLQLYHEFFKTAFFGRPTHNMPFTDSCSGLFANRYKHTRENCVRTHHEARIVNDYYWILWVNLSLPKCTLCNYFCWLCVRKWCNGSDVWPGQWLADLTFQVWLRAMRKLILHILILWKKCLILTVHQTW